MKLKLMALSITIISLAGCLPETNKLQITGIDPGQIDERDQGGQSDQKIEALSVVKNNDTLVVTGKNLDKVSQVKFTGAGTNLNLDIISKSAQQIIIAASSVVNVAMGTIFELTFSSAHASTPPVSIVFNIVDGSITNAKIHSVSDTKITTACLDGQFIAADDGKYVCSNSTWSINGTDNFYTSGNVGIGTNNPRHPLHIIGNTVFGAQNVDPASNRPILHVASHHVDTPPYLMLEFPGYDTAVIGIDGTGSGTHGSNGYLTLASENTLSGIKLKVNGNYFAGQYINTSTVALTVLNNTNVGIGTETPNEKLEVNGNILASGTITQNSDKRWKENVEVIKAPIEKLKKISGVKYVWSREAFPHKNFSEKTQIGVLAQDVQSVFPELVYEDREGFLSVNYAGLIAPLIEAVKEQDSKIKKIEDENKMLKQFICTKHADAPFCSN